MIKNLTRLLSAFENTEFFSKCGSHIDGKYWLVESQDEARTYYGGRLGVRWENFKNSIFNRHRNMVWEATHDYRQEQQTKAKEVMGAVERFLEENNRKVFSRLPEDPDLSRLVLHDFCWIASEVEFANYDTIRYFTTMILPIYLSGHLPCGWRGKPMRWKWEGNSLADLPEGKIIVF